MKLTIGISSCPNDTFAFHALLKQLLPTDGLELEFVIADVQELNELLSRGALDVSKASFHAALHLSDHYGVLPVGAALGDGVGPLLVAGTAGVVPDASTRIACPGAWTTATLLLRCLYPQATSLHHYLFSDIAPAVLDGSVDCGVLIHEGRFTYKEQGLYLIADLGELWQQQTHSLIPLGGLLARTSLPQALHHRLTRLIRASLEYSQQHREEAFSTMQFYAQELSPDAIWPHIDLYVNEHTRNLGTAGAQALEVLQQYAAQHQLTSCTTPLTILE